MGNYERKKSQPCQGCMNALKWIPVLFITAVIVWSYYAYIVQLCFLAIDNIFERIIFIIFYHIIFILFLWSYWSTIFTPTGVVPANWRIPESEVERIFRSDNQENSKRILEHCAKGLPITNRTPNGSVRFCEKCKIIKPDRAHHCSVCGACVLKMDHHCPWVNNCVNFTNYKFFVLFLGYALLYCLYVALTTLEYFIRFWRNELNGGMGRFHILFLFFVSLMFAISLVSLFGYHIYLTLMNRTTLEAFRAPIFRVGGPDKNGFNLGKYANFQEVFGDNWKLWFLPVYTSLGDGLKYPINPDKPQLQAMYPTTNYESMGSTDTRLDVVQPSTKLLNPNERQEQNLHLHHQNHHDHAGVDGRRIAGSGDHGRDTVDAAKSNARLPPINEINFSHNNGNVVVIDMNNISTSATTASASGRGPLTKDATTSPLDKENGMAMLTIDLENQTHNVART